MGIGDWGLGICDCGFGNGTKLQYLNSNCFSENMMNNIKKKANKECKSGTIIITFTKRLTTLNAEWELRDGFRRIMTWGVATIYIHRRK